MDNNNTISEKSFSIRMPDELLNDLRTLAHENERSINKEIVVILRLHASRKMKSRKAKQA